MSNSAKIELRGIMSLAWQFVKRNGYTMSEALRVAWANAKNKAKMSIGIAKFYFMKVDGSMREAFGTLRGDLLPNISKCNRKSNDTVQVYFDTEKQEWRCYKKANLVKIA